MKKRSCQLLIKDCAIVTPALNIERHKSIIINGPYISDIVDAGDEVHHETCIDGTHMLWMPGLIDGHIHTCQQLLRGKILDALPMVWTRILYPFECTLQQADVRLSAQLASLEMIRSGTTSFLEAGGFYMEEAARVYEEAGLRGMITCSTMDQPVTSSLPYTTTEDAIDQLESLYEYIHSLHSKRLRMAYSLRSLAGCSKTVVQKVFTAAKEHHAPVEAHMNEYAFEVMFCLEHYKCRPVEFLDQLGIGDVPFISAHSIFLSEREIELLQRHHACVVHCPFSNSAKGIPNTPRLLAAKIPVALGSDGAAHGGLSIFQEMKIFRTMMNVRYGIDQCNPQCMPAKTILQMAWQGGAAALGLYDWIGAIEPGRYADLIGINLDQPHLQPTGNLLNTIVECMNGSDVESMIVHGKMIMKHHEILTLDEEKIMAEAKKRGDLG